MQKILNYKFQIGDERDYLHSSVQHPTNQKYEVTSVVKKGVNHLYLTAASPSSYIVPFTCPILDQGDIGSCVIHTLAYSILQNTKNTVMPSRLALYAICRILDNTSLDSDDGTMIRTACSAIKNYGVCLEKLYPYVTSKFSDFPPLTIFQNSKIFRSFTYIAIKQDLPSLKNALTTSKRPIVCGIMVYDSFMSNDVALTGIVPMPDTKNETLQGGHAITIIGYDDKKNVFVCVNSWGPTWGDKGKFYMPYNYILDKNLASDFTVGTFVY